MCSLASSLMISSSTILGVFPTNACSGQMLMFSARLMPRLVLRHSTRAARRIVGVGVRGAQATMAAHSCLWPFFQSAN